MIMVRIGRGIRNAVAGVLIPVSVFAQGCIPKKSIRPRAAQSSVQPANPQKTASEPKIKLNLSGAHSRYMKKRARSNYFSTGSGSGGKAAVTKRKTREEQMMGNLPGIRKKILKEFEMERIEKERRKSRR